MLSYYSLFLVCRLGSCRNKELVFSLFQSAKLLLRFWEDIMCKLLAVHVAQFHHLVVRFGSLLELGTSTNITFSILLAAAEVSGF